MTLPHTAAAAAATSGNGASGPATGAAAASAAAPGASEGSGRAPAGVSGAAIGGPGTVRPARQDSGVSDDDSIPELSEHQRIKQRIARDAAGSMFTDPDPESREAAWRQWQQTSGVWRETRDNLNVPDDAGEHAAGLAAILRKVPAGRGRWVNVDRGWYALICALDRQLVALDEAHSVLSVKEKHGRLAYYTSSEKYIGFDNPFHRAKQAAQDRSITICELCGERGQLCETGPMGPPGRWVKTLCPSCAAAGYRGRTYTPVGGG